MCSLSSRLYALLLRWSELCIASVVMIQWPGLQHGFRCYNKAGKLLHVTVSQTQSQALLTESSRVFSDF